MADVSWQELLRWAGAFWVEDICQKGGQGGHLGDPIPLVWRSIHLGWMQGGMVGVGKAVIGGKAPIWSSWADPPAAGGVIHTPLSV